MTVWPAPWAPVPCWPKAGRRRKLLGPSWWRKLSSRAAWLERKIDFHLARQRHVRNAPPGCRCPFCVTTEQIHRELMARAAEGSARYGEPPF